MAKKKETKKQAASKSGEDLMQKAQALPGAAELMQIYSHFAKLNGYYYEAQKALRPQFITTVSSSSIADTSIEENP